jgi:integrase
VSGGFSVQPVWLGAKECPLVSQYRRRPLAQFEHGTRLYAPSAGETRFRVVSTDPVSGERIFAKFSDEERARAKARELEQFIALAAPIRDQGGEGRRTVERLARSYREDHLPGLSPRYQDRQEYLLRRWILPVIGERTVTAWTPADSAAVIAGVRRAGGSDSLVQTVGATMRGLVTHARRLRWLTSQSEDPMWLVRYGRAGTVQGASSLYVPRSSLPSDEECAALFEAFERLGYRRWAVAMRLTHRAGLRWGELTALQAADVEFDPARVVHVRRAVQQRVRGGPEMKRPKNGKVRTTIFPRSLVEDLQALVIEAKERGPEALLFPDAAGGVVRRSNFQQIWVRAAHEAGWPFLRPMKRTGADSAGKGGRWSGAAKWSPHDLRHVAACWMLFDLHLDPAVVADKLGHADPAFTMKRYVGVRGDADLTATAVTECW